MLIVCAIERHDVKVAVANKRDRRIVARPTRARLVGGGAHQNALRARGAIDDDHVAAFDDKGALVIAVPAARDRRHDVANLGVVQFREPGAIGFYRIRGRAVFVEFLPRKIDRRGIAGPSHGAGRIADQFGTSHDAVDREHRRAGRHRRDLPLRGERGPHLRRRSLRRRRSEDQRAGGGTDSKNGKNSAHGLHSLGCPERVIYEAWMRRRSGFRVAGRTCPENGT